MSFWKQYLHLSFDEATHTYRWNGKCVPSVTQLFDRVGVRKDDKLPWGNLSGNEEIPIETLLSFYDFIEKYKARWEPLGCPEYAKRVNDAVFGTAFHKMANGLALGKNVSIPMEMNPWRTKVELFLIKNSFTPIFDENGFPISEYPMYSVMYGFCGTEDFFCRDSKGVLWLIDWKSSANYMKSYSWQTAGYEILVREVFGNKLFDLKEKIIRATVLCDGSDKEAVVVKRENKPEDKIAFMSILNTYKLAA